MSFRQPKQKPCPAALCLYMMGSIPDRSIADPDVDLNPDDESLADIGFTDVSDGTDEDALIAAIDGGSESDDDELTADCGADEDDLETDLGCEDEKRAANCADEAEMIEGIERSPWNGLRADPSNVEVRIAQKYGDVAEAEDRLPSRIGSRRAASLAADDDEATPRPPVMTWKDTAKVPAQHLRHVGRPNGGNDQDRG